jgi:hypothetical protein
MRTIALAAALVLSTVVAGTAPALAACNITNLPCWGQGKKCNIKFRNKTGLAGGSGAGEHNQISLAATLKISAIDENSKQVGSNTLRIAAGDNKTLNLDKKKGFTEISIKANGVNNIRMQCADVKATLKGSGKCDVFTAGKSGGVNSTVTLYLAYKCAGGDVVSH